MTNSTGNSPNSPTNLRSFLLRLARLVANLNHKDTLARVDEIIRILAGQYPDRMFTNQLLEKAALKFKWMPAASELAEFLDENLPPDTPHTEADKQIPLATEYLTNLGWRYAGGSADTIRICKFILDKHAIPIPGSQQPQNLADAILHIANHVPENPKQAAAHIAEWNRKFGFNHVLPTIQQHWAAKPSSCIPWIEDRLYGGKPDPQAQALRRSQVIAEMESVGNNYNLWVEKFLNNRRD